MRVAHLLVVNERPGQVARLASHLLASGDSVHIHVDAKVDQAPFAAAVDPRAQFTAARHLITWGGWNLVEASLSLMRQARAAGDHDYYSLHSGTCYPIRPLAEFHAHLDRCRGLEFIEACAETAWTDGFRSRHERPWFRDEPRLRFLHRIHQHFPRRRPPEDCPLHVGSTWWTLSRAAVDVLLEVVASRPDLVGFFRRTDIPEEIFFPSLLMITARAGHVCNAKLRHIEWLSHAEHPLVFRRQDFGKLANSPAFFARKFDASVDAEILDRLDALLAGRLDPRWRDVAGSPRAAPGLRP
jgi:Core-2/I-Branching enzyme